MSYSDHHIRVAEETDLQHIHQLIHKTVEVSYPAIYPPKVVRFFLQHHNLAEITKRLTEGVVLVLTINDSVTGTGFVRGDELGGVYIDPLYQRQGLGTAIVKRLLGSARQQKINRLWLHSTPMAKPMYDKSGFKLISEMVMYIEDEPLLYYEMEIKFPTN
jgi:N-acetylglutamate synthase-like GNAT family acetyltransferase